MINRVVLVGRLTKDPELRYTPSGVAMARFTLAVNRTFSNQQGEREADFINCVVWRKQAENTANFLKKGSLAGVEGRIQTGSLKDKMENVFIQQKLSQTAFSFLEPRSSSGDRGQSGQPLWWRTTATTAKSISNISAKPTNESAKLYTYR